MATLCTEISMPKYRENKKKWKSFSSWQYSCQHLSQAVLGVWRCVCALYSMCHPCVWLCTCFWMLRKTHSCCVTACTNPANVCVNVTPFECLCMSEYAFTHEYLRFYIYIQSLLSSFPAHFLCVDEREQFYMYASVCKAHPSVFMHTSKASSFTPHL